MKKYVAVILALIVPMSIAPAMTAQTATATTKPLTDPPSKKLETLFTDAEIPVTKTKSGLYIGVVTVGDDSDRFSAQADTMGSDPNNTVLQYATIYVSLGDLPKGVQLSAPLAKQIVQWNSNLSVGKIVQIDDDFYYSSTLWLEHADGNALEREAVIGHFNAKSLRKELLPYLKQ